MSSYFRQSEIRRWNNSTQSIELNYENISGTNVFVCFRIFVCLRISVSPVKHPFFFAGALLMSIWVPLLNTHLKEFVFADHNLIKIRKVGVFFPWWQTSSCCCQS